MIQLRWFFLLLSLAVAGCETADRPPAATPGPGEITTFILVRHAEKADDGTSDPGLTPSGHARARRLADMLGPAGVQAIFSTAFQRTRQTAQPLAERTGLEVVSYNPADRQLAQQLLSGHASKTILIVGHSNTVPALVNDLIGEPAYEPLNESEYDKLFVVSVMNAKGRAVVLSY